MIISPKATRILVVEQSRVQASQPRLLVDRQSIPNLVRQLSETARQLRAFFEPTVQTEGILHHVLGKLSPRKPQGEDLVGKRFAYDMLRGNAHPSRIPRLIDITSLDHLYITTSFLRPLK